MDEYRLRTQVWQAALVIGSLRGCRPSPSIEYLLQSIEKHDGVEIGPHDWPFYAMPSWVDDRYAACLVDALAEPWTTAHDDRAILASVVVPLGEDQIRKLGEVRNWCVKGGFEVHTVAQTLTILSRPGPSEDSLSPTL